MNSLPLFGGADLGCPRMSDVTRLLHAFESGDSAAADQLLPLVWSGKTHQGSPDGGMGDLVGWVYERPTGGRSFGFTGIDAHSAWALPGMRQLVVNGILWTANLAIPNGGAPNKITETALDSYLTPR